MDLRELGLHLVERGRRILHCLGPAQGFGVVLTVFLGGGVQPLLQLLQLLLLGLNLLVEHLGLGCKCFLAVCILIKCGGDRLHLASQRSELLVDVLELLPKLFFSINANFRPNFYGHTLTSSAHIRNNFFVCGLYLPRPEVFPLDLLDGHIVQQFSRRNIQGLVIGEPRSHPIPHKPLRGEGAPGMAYMFFPGTASTVRWLPLTMVSWIFCRSRVKSPISRLSYRSS